MYHAASELLGDTVPDEYDSEYAALTPKAVAAAFAAVYPSLLMVVPPDLSPPTRARPLSARTDGHRRGSQLQAPRCAPKPHGSKDELRWRARGRCARLTGQSWDGGALL
jgi:hypothetical protein